MFSLGKLESDLFFTARSALRNRRGIALDSGEPLFGLQSAGTASDPPRMALKIEIVVQMLVTDRAELE